VSEDKIKTVEFAIAGILDVFEDSDYVRELKSKSEEVKSSLNYDSLFYCIDKYINSELDSRTRGNRGIGRMTTWIPRLGAYYRKEMSRLSTKNLSELYTLMQDVIFRAYLARPLIVENPISMAKLSKGSELYEAWIPGIYVVDPFGEKLLDMIDACTSTAWESFLNFLKKHGMSRPGTFPNEKMDEILFRYVVAGYYLRVVEVNPPRTSIE